MTTRFRTNIDCAKKFMSDISEQSILPAVGDLITVHKTSEIEINMPVIQRTWIFPEYKNPVLICELGLPPYFKDIRIFEDFLWSKGYRW